MPKTDQEPTGALARMVDAAADPAPVIPAVAATDAPSIEVAPPREHYLVLEDLPAVAAAGRILRANPARARAWLDASAVRIATAREIELAEPRFIDLED